MYWNNWPFTPVHILSSRLVIPPYCQEYSPISTCPIFITTSLVLSYKKLKGKQGNVLEKLFFTLIHIHTCYHSLLMISDHLSDEQRSQSSYKQ